MIRFGLRIAGVVLLGSLLAACALTRDEVALGYSYKGRPLAQASAGTKQSLAVQKFEDRRGVDDPRLIMNKRNAYNNVMSGGYLAEKPVVEIVRDAVADGFKKAGYDVGAPSATLQLQGQLIDYSYEVISGFWSVTVKSQMTVKLELIDGSTNTPKWSETFIGRGTAESDFVKTGFNQALDDVVAQAIESRGFRQHFAAR